jgi:hypothetical protein
VYHFIVYNTPSHHSPAEQARQDVSLHSTDEEAEDPKDLLKVRSTLSQRRIWNSS